MTYAEKLTDRYAAARSRLLSGQEPPAKPRRFLLPPQPRPAPVCIPEAVRRKVKVPRIIRARYREDQDDLLPLPDAEKWKAIIAEVCEKHGIDWIDLASARRSVPVVIARHEAMYRMRHETTMSLPAIGRKLGGLDHSSVIHGIRRHEERLECGEL
jgi:hypothetical protein